MYVFTTLDSDAGVYGVALRGECGANATHAQTHTHMHTACTHFNVCAFMPIMMPFYLLQNLSIYLCDFMRMNDGESCSRGLTKKKNELHVDGALFYSPRTLNPIELLF